MIPFPCMSHAAGPVGHALLVLLLAGSGEPAASRTEPAVALVRTGDAERLLREVEARHAKARSLSASFTQSYRSAELGQEVVERGRLFVKRPGRMRWDYRHPDKKVFVVSPDGSTLTYVPADLMAVRSKIPVEAVHLKLLLGESDLLASFEVSSVRLKNPRNPQARHLRLQPRAPLDGVELLYLEIDPATRSIERILAVDALKNESELVLDRVREDVALRDADFDVHLPPSVDVRDATAASGR